MPNKTYRIERMVLAEGVVEVVVPEGVTPLITPDGTAIIIVQDVTTTPEVLEALEA